MAQDELIILSVFCDFLNFQIVARMTEKNSALRFTDIGTLSKRMISPIDGFAKMPVVSLEEAVKSLVDIVPEIERNAYFAKESCQEPEDGLTSNESASIMLYTFESKPHENSLYVILNTTLRSPQREELLEPWLLYLRLVVTALTHLPSQHRFVNRGVKEDLRPQYPIGRSIVWWGFSSCTTSIAVLECEHFFGKSGTRTLFQIECHSGKDVKNHSSMQHEDEILLLPARQFMVTSCLDSGNGLHIIQLKETEPRFPLLEPVSLPTRALPHAKNEASSSGAQKPISPKPLEATEPKYHLPEPAKLPTPKSQLPPPKPILPVQPLIAPNLSGQFLLEIRESEIWLIRVREILQHRFKLFGTTYKVSPANCLRAVT